MRSQFGKYELLERIGAGAMAEVFRARAASDPEMPPIAIKRFTPQVCNDEQFAERFARETRLTVALAHDNILRVLDAGAVDGVYYIAIELVDGHSLSAIQRTLTSRRAMIPIPTAAYIATGICRALTCVHGVRANDRPLAIVHGRVGPPHVILSFAGEVKLTNLGLARLEPATDDETAPDGSPHGCAYAAPELVRHEAIDARADLFSLGALLHELLTGRALFLATTPTSTLQHILHQRIPLPSEHNPRVPAALDTIVTKALRRSVTERYQSSREMLTDLQRFCSDADAALGAADLAQWIRRNFPPGAIEPPRARTIDQEAAGAPPTVEILDDAANDGPPVEVPGQPSPDAPPSVEVLDQTAPDGIPAFDDADLPDQAVDGGPPLGDDSEGPTSLYHVRADDPTGLRQLDETARTTGRLATQSRSRRSKPLGEPSRSVKVLLLAFLLAVVALAVLLLAQRRCDRPEDAGHPRPATFVDGDVGRSSPTNR